MTSLILEVALPFTLFCIMFSMGTSLVPANFKPIVYNPVSMLVGLISQMLLLPSLAFILLSPLQLQPEIFVGFMILALSPGGTTSNLFSYLASGNVALSIALTAVISIVTPFTIPLLAGWILAGQLDSTASIQLPFLQTLVKLLAITVIPVVLGMLLRHFRKDFCIRHKILFTRIPLIMLLLVVSAFILQNWESMPLYLRQTGWASILLASLALCAGYYFARLMKRNRADARTIAIETSIQNGGTAILITGTILQNPAMTIAPVMYGILMLIPVFSYLIWLNKRPVALAT